MVAETIHAVARHQLQAVPERFRRAPEAEEVLDVDAVHHHPAEQQHPRRRHLQVLEALAKMAAVVLDHFQRTAELGGAVLVRVVVRRVRAQGVAQLSV
ncbi:hypothetical protein D9M71_684130 [compost metagenome]